MDFEGGVPLTSEAARRTVCEESHGLDLRPRVNNKIRREAFEALNHLRQTNRFGKWRNQSWLFLNFSMDSAVAGWAPTLHALFIGPLTDETPAITTTQLPWRINAPMLPKTVQGLAAPRPGVSIHEAQLPSSPSGRMPVYPWGLECNNGLSILSFGWQMKKTLRDMPTPSTSDSEIAIAPKLIRESSEDDDGDVSMRSGSSADEEDYEEDFFQNADEDVKDFDYFEDIKDPDYRFMCQTHEVLLEFATVVVGVALGDHHPEAFYEELPVRVEALFQILRARAYHMCGSQVSKPTKSFSNGPMTRARARAEGVRESQALQSEADWTCIICLEHFSKDKPMPQVPCGHELCGTCLLRWLIESKGCPMCRKIISAQDALPHVTGADIDEILAETIPKFVMLHAFGKVGHTVMPRLSFTE